MGSEGGRGAAGSPSVTRCHGSPFTLCDVGPFAGLPPPVNCTPLEEWDVPCAVCPGDQHSARHSLGGSMKLSGEGGRDRALGHSEGPVQGCGVWGVALQPPQEGDTSNDLVPTASV